MNILSFKTTLGWIRQQNPLYEENEYNFQSYPLFLKIFSVESSILRVN